VSEVKTLTDATFDTEVADAGTPMIVDFWAPWCGPCRQLTPLLEKAVRAAKGKVKLVKMNIDEHPAIPGQMGIQSIPAVIAFVDGRPADGFMGAVPESQITAFSTATGVAASRNGTPAPAKLNPPNTRLYDNSQRNWSSSNASSDAQSIPFHPGMTRRNGLTIQSVSAMTACPSGLRNGARSSCIANRSSNAYVNSPKMTSSR